MPIVSVNNANFYYESQGTGEPVILIAGFTCDHLSWQPIVDELSQYFQVVVFDNRGAGQTVDDNKPLSVKLMAADVIALADKLHLKQPHIVGQSMGGTIAQAVASFYSEKIGKLCLLTTSAKWRQAMLRGRKNSLIMQEKNIDFDVIFEAGLPWIFGESFLKNDKMIEDLKRSILENPYPQSLIDATRQFKVLEQFDGTHALKNIRAPTLIAYGIQDIVTLPRESKYLATQIPQAKLVEFDCGHGIMLEAPEQLTQELIHFLSEN